MAFSSLLCCFNMIYLLVGIALTGVGSYVYDAIHDYSGLTGSSFSILAASTIALGVIIFLIALTAIICWVKEKQDETCVYFFVRLLVFISILQISGGIAGFVFKQQVEGNVEMNMKDGMPKTSNVWDKVQREFECCGIKDASDWQRKILPDACGVSPKSECKLKNKNSYFNDGCLHKFTSWVDDRVYLLGVIGFTFAFLPMFGAICAGCFSKEIEKRKKREVVKFSQIQIQ